MTNEILVPRRSITHTICGKFPKTWWPRQYTCHNSIRAGLGNVGALGRLKIWRHFKTGVAWGNPSLLASPMHRCNQEMCMQLLSKCNCNPWLGIQFFENPKSATPNNIWVKRREKIKMQIMWRNRLLKHRLFMLFFQ